MCGARATRTVSVKLNLGTQTAATVSVKLNQDERCRGYSIREDGNLAAEITDVWRMRHSYRIREVEPG